MAASGQGSFTRSLPEIYERFLVAPLFRPFAQALLDRASLVADDRLLDVACGTGIVARLARQTIGDRGRVVGIDASPGMIGMAKSVAPSIEWREGNAARLPVGSDETFTVITCHQGLQFFSDKMAAAQEAHRVLAPSGRIAIGTWRAVDDIPLMRVLQRVAERHLGPFTDVRHSFGELDAITRLLDDAGFQRIEAGTITRTIRMDGPLFPQLNTMAVLGMSPAVKSMSDEERGRISAAITNDSIEAVKPFLDGDALVFDLVSSVVTARR